MANPKDTTAFARVGLVCGRSRHMGPDTLVDAADGLTHGNLRDLLSDAFEAGDRLQRIVAWHSRESAHGGLVGDYCMECGHRWPCDTRRMADGTYVDPAPADNEEGQA